jgi:plastocyanin
MDISSKTRIYGILEAIDKSGNFGTVSTDNSVKLRVKFDGSTTCAYTGDTCTLKTGDKLSFIPNKKGHIIVATDTHIFNYEDKASSSFDETDSISDTFYEIHQRETRFANKGLGIVVREDTTKYGSISLYDNYDDESGS